MEIAVISGKGGTGKSSITAAFATMQSNIVLADCDVDAANQYILFAPTQDEEEIYISGFKAIIDKTLCTNCGVCVDFCRFDAIFDIGGEVEIDQISCDGCKLCSRVCPRKQFRWLRKIKAECIPEISGMEKWYMVGLHRRRKSGRLVNLVRSKAKEIAKANNIETIILDGPPGIGCP
jgi:MinD superfamily P-loop ATPase